MQLENFRPFLFCDGLSYTTINKRSENCFMRLMGNSSLQTRLNWTIEQLKTFSNYAIIVQAFNRRGAGPKSPEIIVTTMEDGK